MRMFYPRSLRIFLENELDLLDVKTVDLHGLLQDGLGLGGAAFCQQPSRALRDKEVDRDQDRRRHRDHQLERPPVPDQVCDSG